MDFVGAYGARYSGSTKMPCSPPPEFSKLIRAASDVEDTYLSLADVRAANGTLGSLHAKSGLSIWRSNYR